RILSIAASTLAGGGLIAGLLAGFDPVATLFTALAGGLIALAAVKHLALMDSLYRLNRAIRELDPEAAAKELPDLMKSLIGRPSRFLISENSKPLVIPNHARKVARWELLRAWTLAERERFEESEAILESLDLSYEDQSPADQQVRISIASSRAWNLAHLGRTDEAIALARNALEQEKQRGGRLCSYLAGMVGIVQVLARTPQEAMPVLSSLVAEGKDGPPTQAVYLYYIGEAQHMLGNREAALDAYKRASALAPNTLHGRKA